MPLGGFNFDNCLRNTALEANTNSTHKTSYTKTGTTICGVVFNVSIHHSIVLTTKRKPRFYKTAKSYVI